MLDKKFSCFVCYEIFDLYCDFKEHIIKNHEEVREYLICPLKHCQCPVRDLRIHFKAKHPGIILPKTIQMRATVWYDFKDGVRKKKTTGFKDGYVVSKKNKGASVHYRSSYEETVYLCLEQMSEIASYEPEPFAIPYIFHHKNRRYYPDLKINFSNGKVELWEIKPKAQTHIDQNKVKWRAAEEFCFVRGWTFKVITEKEINEMKAILNENHDVKLNH